jgi:CRP/FNR family transcriptional regulator, cyclic AMP receptor protein
MAMSQPGNQDLARSIARIKAFKDLPADNLGRIQRECASRRFEMGEPIVHYLDPPDDVYFISAGLVRVSLYSLSGKVVTFCDLGAGDMFGEISAFDGAPRSASVEALTTCSVLSMPAERFREIVQSEPAVSRALFRYLAVKIRDLTTRIYEFSALPVSNRIDAEILRLAKLAKKSDKMVHIATLPTHAEIASRTSTHREAVTRELNRLKRIGLIQCRGRSLIVTDFDRLEALVQEATGE